MQISSIEKSPNSMAWEAKYCRFGRLDEPSFEKARVNFSACLMRDLANFILRYHSSIMDAGNSAKDEEKYSCRCAVVVLLSCRNCNEYCM